MSDEKEDGCHNAKVDYSKVTPATSDNPYSMNIAETYANQMPTADSPSVEGSLRADPDKTVPGPEAATGVDEAEVEQTETSINNDK